MWHQGESAFHEDLGLGGCVRTLTYNVDDNHSFLQKKAISRVRAFDIFWYYSLFETMILLLHIWMLIILIWSKQQIGCRISCMIIRCIINDIIENIIEMELNNMWMN